MIGVFDQIFNLATQGMVVKKPDIYHEKALEKYYNFAVGRDSLSLFVVEIHAFLRRLSQVVSFSFLRKLAYKVS